LRWGISSGGCVVSPGLYPTDDADVRGAHALNIEIHSINDFADRANALSGQVTVMMTGTAHLTFGCLRETFPGQSASAANDKRYRRLPGNVTAAGF
jgi:hypothetical protein